MPLTLPPESTQLRYVAPGFIWIAVLLSFMLASERLFQQDYDEGLMEQWLFSGHSISILIGAKMFVHWSFHLLSILIFCPFLALILALTPQETWILVLTLISGTPALLSLCALAAALGVGAKQKSILIALVLLPLTIPIMIFASSALLAAMQSLPVSGYLAWLTAISLIMSSILPWAIGNIIRAKA